jgi:N-methylhydantoinase A/acetophenone carboxylase
VTLAINVDVGGTFTDAFVMDGGRFATGKDQTTPHDLSVGFVGAVTQALAALGVEVGDAFRRADHVKYATTVGMNALVERVGPRVGLITTRGQEDTLHLGRSRSWADGLAEADQLDRTRARRPPDLVPRELRVGVPERIDCFGKVVMPLRAEDVAEQVDRLIAAGAQAFAVCLAWSFANPVHERLVRDVIRELYPASYLGRAPVLLSSEAAPKLDEYRRTVTTVLAAFLAAGTEEHLLDLGDRLRELGYRRPLLLARNTGGVASPSRTTALHLLGAGAVAGLSGAALLARRYRLANVIAADMGGTTFDVGLIIDGHERTYEFNPIVDRWRIHLPVIANFSIGAGGGSIAWVDPEGRLRVGPRSAGSMPGPVCYDNGGTEPTVTDADLVLGYLDPDYFLGGRFPLNRRKAERALRRRIAEPLAIGLEEAALRVRRLVDGLMGQEIFKRTALKGHDPRDFAMFAFGGAGPVHAAEVAGHAEVGEVLTFPFGPEFNAFGAAAMDVVQSYERTHRMLLYDPVRDRWLEDLDGFNRVVDELLELAARDLAEEGFHQGETAFELELDMNYAGQQHTVRHTAPSLRLDGPAAVRRLAETFNQTFAGVYGAGAAHPEGGIQIQLFKLTATATLAKPDLVEREAEPGPPAAKGTRDCWWPSAGPLPTPVYERRLVGPGARLQGPALLEDVETVVAVPPGWVYAADRLLTGRLTRSRP